MPNFEKFRRYKVTEAPAPMVAFHVRGIFALNELAYAALGRPEALELLYDRDEKTIGLKGASRDSPDSYAVRHNTKHSYQVEGRSFIKFYEIPNEAAGRRYKAEMIGDVLAVDLRQQLEDNGKEVQSVSKP
ncbi:MAG: hypothetical protein JOY53_01100 [Acidobacteriaceae bacterium]|nr:hypothetical protein [Acidobacteriaceae bacterium]